MTADAQALPVSNLAPLLDRNRAFATSGARYDVPPLPFVPRQLLYVITCVDPRVDPGATLGLRLGDAIVARNVGGRVTAAVIQDLAWISYLKQTKAPDDPFFEVAVIHHTDCGSGLLADHRLRRSFAERIGVPEAPLADLAVLDPYQTVRHDVERLLSAPELSPQIAVSGHVYDVATGQVETVQDPRRPAPRP